MVVPSIVLVTIIVFIVVDLLLRTLLGRMRAERIRRERERALDQGLRLDVSEEAPSLSRVALEQPKARILAVDDEPAVLDSFRKILVLGGYSIDTVERGQEALGLLRQHDYDFVFTDLKMPDMGGVEVTRAVKHLRPDIDVIVITGYATVETAVETIGAGAMDYVQKPFTADELLGFVRHAVIRREDRLQREARHRIHVIEPGTRESKSRLELNVPAGAFVSPQHAWARIELNGSVRIGLDDLIRKVFGTIDRVDLPQAGRRVRRGEKLFAVTYGDQTLDIPAPLSGTVLAVNEEHSDHPEWLAAKPFEASWMCALEPSDLASELAELKIGRDAIDWYQAELDRFATLARQYGSTAIAQADASIPRAAEREPRALLGRFTEAFLP